jgi:hypothetical protein
MVTPPHIVPEWYFLPFYAILRSIPDKLGGVVAMGAALVVLIFLPFLHTSSIRSTSFRPIHKFFFLNIRRGFINFRLNWRLCSRISLFRNRTNSDGFLFCLFNYFNSSYWIIRK